MNFYSKDLSFAMRLNKKDFIHKTEYGKVFIEPYITSALSDEAKDPRIDLLNRSIENKEMLQRVLHIDHAPLGKWPSRYAPAFMQQFAINLAISNILFRLLNCSSLIFTPKFVSINDKSLQYLKNLILSLILNENLVQLHN